MERHVNIIDVRGRSSPVDIIEVKWVLDRCRPGAEVRILATDPGFSRNLMVYCSQTGSQIIESSATGNGFAYTVEKHSREPFVV
jgi:tRNA 2-thiouridine synthesizing protein A